METDLNRKATEIRQEFSDKEDQIAKWKDKFEMNERLVVNMREAEERLKSTHQIELYSKIRESQQNINDLRQQLSKKEAALEKCSNEISTCHDSIEQKQEEIRNLENTISQKEIEFKSQLQSLE